MAAEEISRGDGQDGRRSGTGKVDDGGMKREDRMHGPGPKPWMREVDLL